ncbi:hypothetical protein GCM10029976_042640 [Kribbella albertanoniae]|uniref:Ricin B lectin domain-containing protein n=1 Tax=Kribbella albertanoniae TaxID=1266829 RepID=A0A4R4QEV5_9ACTN|nr:RICIN domain-containing protein [Kribbella albertanoniae]TDC34048.1 hypothetical protein E1261_04905 [Kribbella albertanoniae]
MTIRHMPRLIASVVISVAALGLTSWPAAGVTSNARAAQGSGKITLSSGQSLIDNRDCAISFSTSNCKLKVGSSANAPLFLIQRASSTEVFIQGRDNLYMDVALDSTSSGTAIIMRRFDGSPSQRWRALKVFGATNNYRFQNVNSGLLVTVVPSDSVTPVRQRPHVSGNQNVFIAAVG